MMPLATTLLDVFGIVGVIVLIVLAAGVTFVAYHLWRFKRAMSAIGEQFKTLGEVMKRGVVPATLGLERLDEAELSTQPDLLAAASQFAAAGLERGGIYTLAKMPAARVATFADPSRSVMAAAFVVPGRGLNVDVVTMFDDGSSLTHRTLASLGLEHPPKFERVVMTGASPTELLEEHLASRDASKAPRAIEPGAVADAMEEQNAEDVRWRDGRGGLTAGEIRASQRAAGKPEPNAMQMAILLASSRAESARRVADADRDALLASGAWTRERWDADGERVVFVSDETDVDAVFARLNALAIALTDEAAEQFAAGAATSDVRSAFATWASSRDDLTIEPIATFAAPATTDAYFIS